MINKLKTYSQKDIATQLKTIGLSDRVVGIHSQLSSMGSIEQTEVSKSEAAKGMKPFAKTVINALIDALGSRGTFFVPTHTVNTMSHYGLGRSKAENGTIIDDGYYRAESTPSTLGSFTQSVLADNCSLRSLHPTHSIAAIGAEAAYLVNGHDHTAQPVGIMNAFSKLIGLDGIVMFIGPVLGSSTTFHAYETLMLPALADYLPGVAAAEIKGIKRLIPQTWVPHFHRDFYSEGKRATRAWKKLKEAGLLHSTQLGDGTAYWFEAKKTARFFANEVFPTEPDILFCNSPEKCNTFYDCATTIGWLKELYATGNKWSKEKVIEGMDKNFLQLLKDGQQRVLTIKI
jgi:aminoglycoside 3-N-acetyltransferase